MKKGLTVRSVGRQHHKQRIDRSVAFIKVMYST